MSGAEIFISVIFLIPIYGLLIYSYINPEESYDLFGKKSIMDEDIELIEEEIQWLKLRSLFSIIILTLVIVMMIYKSTL
ncbi:hypothetical protein [Alkaliphilus hydrothermalis]|uniref:Selenocysteine lyase n=1 Tax=Alkaliphilus hydrothermalis TaxID=1482730 RepID=A0ABS2NS52_9FIRM|nr:hypothetical protein [Alkaliphilus hydrothermalis]MBM7615794.1 hypothetical protein [Alkaliphilus hydrothermalis]